MPGSFPFLEFISGPFTFLFWEVTIFSKGTIGLLLDTVLALCVTYHPCVCIHMQAHMSVPVHLLGKGREEGVELTGQ